MQKSIDNYNKIKTTDIKENSFSSINNSKNITLEYNKFIKTRNDLKQEFINENISKLLENIDYKNIDNLVIEDIEKNIQKLHKYYLDGYIKINEIITNIIPNNEYAQALFFTDNFIEKGLNREINRIKKIKPNAKNYIDKYEKILKESNNALNYKNKHILIFELFIKYFGSDIDLNKSHNIFIDVKHFFQHLDYNHQNAIDIFYKPGLNPKIHAFRGGIVIASEDGWDGGFIEKNYNGKGLSPKSGNGVIIYNPVYNEFYAYLHLDEVNVKKGDLIMAGDLLGKGGNTGLNASKPGHGDHLHFAIHKIEDSKNIFLNVREIYSLLTNENVYTRNKD